MEKIPVSIKNLKQEGCYFCNCSSKEIRIVLRTVFVRLRTMLRQPRYASMSSKCNIETVERGCSIGRMIRVLFGHQQFQLKMSSECSHLKLHGYLSQKLKCRGQQLETMIEDMCDKIARRNYQLEIISSTVKNAQSSVTQLQEAPVLQRENQKGSVKTSSQAKQEHIQQKQQKAMAEVKVQSIPFSPRVAQVSPATRLPEDIVFAQMPYSYNFMFYGPFYQ